MPSIWVVNRRGAVHTVEADYPIGLHEKDPDSGKLTPISIAQLAKDRRDGWRLAAKSDIEDYMKREAGALANARAHDLTEADVAGLATAHGLNPKDFSKLVGTAPTEVAGEFLDLDSLEDEGAPAKPASRAGRAAATTEKTAPPKE